MLCSFFCNGHGGFARIPPFFAHDSLRIDLRLFLCYPFLLSLIQSDLSSAS